MRAVFRANCSRALTSKIGSVQQTLSSVRQAVASTGVAGARWIKSSSLCPRSGTGGTMGLDYAFELIAERSSADRVIRAIAEHLDPTDSGRLLACVPSDVDCPLGDIERTPLEQNMSDLCLGFLFPPDGQVEAYSPERKLINGLVRIGCVWSTLIVEGNLVIFRATAATTGMSLLFEESPSVRNTWISIAQKAGALLLLLDDERFDNRAIWPVERLLGHPAADTPGEEGRYRALIKEAGLQAPERPDGTRA